MLDSRLRSVLRWVLPGALLALPAATSFAGPPETIAPEAAPAAPEGGSTVPVATLRQQMEENIAEIADLANEARRDNDIVRADCVLAKQEQAQGVMEVATGELLVIRDSSQPEQQRRFAAEKLEAAAQRLDGLVEAARSCAGDKTPEINDDEVNTDEEVVPMVPEADPTQSGGQPPQPSPVPPSVDDQRPPTVGSPSK